MPSRKPFSNPFPPPYGQTHCLLRFFHPCRGAVLRWAAAHDPQEEAKTAMLELADLTEGFATGSPPDPQSVLGYESRIIKLYCLLGEQMAHKFGAKEKAYLARKVEQARQHAHGRVQLEMTSKDSE